MGQVIGLELAHRIKAAGIRWEPSAGDHFHVPDRDLDETDFVVSNMVVEVLELPSRQRYFGFNGTTEWALDSLKTEQVLWLPREDQLRDALGDRLSRLERTADGWSVVLVDGRRFADPDVESAYAQALLATA